MSASLRIALLVNPFSHTLKGDQHAPEMARELLGRGHTVRGFGAPPGTIPRSGDEPTEGGGVSAEENSSLHGFRPDVIVAYDALSPAAWLGARRARKLGCALVLVEEGMPEGGGNIERGLRWIGERLWGGFVRRAASFVVALDPVAHAQVLSEGFAESDIRDLSAGVHLSTFRPGLASQIPSRHGIHGRILLHTGRIEEGRGIEDLIRAFAQTVGQRQDWSLVLAGDGPGKRALRALVNRLGVGSRVHWLSKPRAEELPGLLGACTLFADPRAGDDVSTLTIRRALACGLPVLASDGPRVRSLLEDDGCGLLAGPEGGRNWTETLRLAASAPERRRRWRIRAREIAESRFAWPVIGEAFENYLHEAHNNANAVRESAGQPLQEG
jgi:glycosyltransferase involved in cell wall biosynthesis